MPKNENHDCFHLTFFTEAEKKSQKLHFNFHKGILRNTCFFFSCLPACRQAMVLMLRLSPSRTSTAVKNALMLYES
jgi:hypothetical protein